MSVAKAISDAYPRKDDPSDYPAPHTIRIFTSYLVVLVQRGILDDLTKQGLVSKDGGRYFFDVKKYLDLIDRRTSWGKILGNSQDTSPFYVEVADPCESATTELYLALMSHVILGHVLEEQSIPSVAARMHAQFESDHDPSNRDVLGAFFSGSGSRRTALAYEHDVFHELIENSGRASTFAYLYPSPLVPSDHTIVAKDTWGEWVADALREDPGLIRMQTGYGFPMDNHSADVAANVKKATKNFSPSSEAPNPSLPSIGEDLPIYAVLGKLADKVPVRSCPKTPSSMAPGGDR